MDPLEGSWMQSPSGSRAEETWPDEEEEYNSYDIFAVGDGEAQGEDDFALSNSVFGTDLAPGQLMSPKVPPAFPIAPSGPSAPMLFKRFDGVCINILYERSVRST